MKYKKIFFLGWYYKIPKNEFVFFDEQ